MSNSGVSVRPSFHGVGARSRRLGEGAGEEDMCILWNFGLSACLARGTCGVGRVGRQEGEGRESSLRVGPGVRMRMVNEEEEWMGGRINGIQVECNFVMHSGVIQIW